MTNTPILKPGLADDRMDLEVALCAGLLRDLRDHAASALEWLGSAQDTELLDISDEALDLLDRGLDAAIAACTLIRIDFEDAYLLAYELREQQAQEQAEQARFVDAFRQRITFVGQDTPPHAWTLMGWIQDNPLWPFAVSRDTGHVVLAAGSQGAGKTIMSTLIGEGCLVPGAPISSDHALPTAYCFFHIEEGDRLPQLLDGLKSNPTQRDLQVLLDRLGVAPRGLPRVRLTATETALKDLRPRLRPYEDLGLEVVELNVRLSQLGQRGLEAALEAEEGARYVRRMLEDAEDQGKDLEIEGMRYFIEKATDLTSSMKRSAHARLKVLEELAGPADGPGLFDIFEPYVATVAYLVGPYQGVYGVAPALVGLLNGLMLPSDRHGEFQRVIVVDEVNLLEELDAVWRAFIRVARLIRHRGSTLVLMGQDLLCVPDELFGLAGLVAVFQLRNPRVWEHIRERVGALRAQGWMTWRRWRWRRRCWRRR